MSGKEDQSHQDGSTNEWLQTLDVQDPQEEKTKMRPKTQRKQAQEIFDETPIHKETVRRTAKDFHIRQCPDIHVLQAEQHTKANAGRSLYPKNKNKKNQQCAVLKYQSGTKF